MGLPPTARAQAPSWLIEHLSGFYTVPSPATRDLPTSLVLWGWFPYDCGEVADAQAPDAEHIELTLRPGSACPDTARVWHQAFSLGALPAGQHPVHVTIRFVDQDQSVTVGEGSFAFEVVDPDVPPPPPPPPPDPPSWLLRGLSGYATTPVAPPSNQAPTTLVLVGWFPYDCGRVADARVVEPDHVALTLEQLLTFAPCQDSVRRWSQPFDLGLLAAGTHRIRIDLTVWRDPAESEEVVLRTGEFDLEVTDGGVPPPPPPPPPNDSLVSTSRPNPFVAATRFAVHLDAPAAVEVGVFDLSGREVARLWSGALPAGSREFVWDGRRADGARAPGGMYFTRVATPGRVATRRVVLLPRP